MVGYTLKYYKGDTISGNYGGGGLYPINVNIPTFDCYTFVTALWTDVEFTYAYPQYEKTMPYVGVRILNDGRVSFSLNQTNSSGTYRFNPLFIYVLNEED